MPPRSQYQYQAITGPVWREPVAAAMAWTPTGRDQPPRALPPNSLGSYSIPFVAALAVAAGLSWLPAGNARLAALPPARASADQTVVAPFQAPAFDPRLFPFVDTPRVARLELRVVGATVEPFLTDVAVGIDASWPVPILPPRAIATWTLVQPFTAALAVFDPSGLQWLPTGARPTSAERRVRIDAALPFVAALYRPEGLQWVPAGREVGPRAPLAGLPTWSFVGSLLVAAPFDPATLVWLPEFHGPTRLPVRWWTGPTTQEPLRNFDPSRLQWLPKDQAPVRFLVAARLGIDVLDPLPRPHLIIALPLEIEDRSGFRYWLLDQSTRRYLVAEQSRGQATAADQSQSAERLGEQSGPKLGTKDTA